MNIDPESGFCLCICVRGDGAITVGVEPLLEAESEIEDVREAGSIDEALKVARDMFDQISHGGPEEAAYQEAFKG